MKILDIQIDQIVPKSDVEISETFYKECKFCKKLVRTNLSVMRSCVNLSRNKFYCAFCLRHNHHFKNSKNILRFSYRAIIGYYYQELYLDRSKLYLSQILDMEQTHHEIGIKNPVLSYDYSTLMWFADFNKIGNHKNKAPYLELEATMEKMLNVFRLNEFVGKGESEFWTKLQSATVLFYKQRSRPKDRPILTPTLQNIAQYSQSDTWYRDFDSYELRLRN